LFYGEGYSYQQIANLTGYPIKAVKSHIQNGRRGFRQHWKG
jgi:DNA-directed RNA polymerase specialized sigma24 family protein